MPPSRNSRTLAISLVVAAVSSALTYGVLQTTGRRPCSPGDGEAGVGPAHAIAVDPARQILFSTRVCGSPAVDGYAHVKPDCINNSPTAQWYREWGAAGGSQDDFVVHMEEGADYDGLAVVWGIGNTKASAEECARQCYEHKAGTVDGPYKQQPCNVFAYCADDTCFEPDAHQHSRGDCWLKFTEAPANPEVNMRGVLPPEFRARHPKAPEHVQWVTGVVLPLGVQLRNGTWSPRWFW